MCWLIVRSRELWRSDGPPDIPLDRGPPGDLRDFPCLELVYVARFHWPVAGFALILWRSFFFVWVYIQRCFIFFFYSCQVHTYYVARSSWCFRSLIIGACGVLDLFERESIFFLFSIERKVVETMICFNICVNGFWRLANL